MLFRSPTGQLAPVLLILIGAALIVTGGPSIRGQDCQLNPAPDCCCEDGEFYTPASLSCSGPCAKPPNANCASAPGYYAPDGSDGNCIPGAPGDLCHHRMPDTASGYTIDCYQSECIAEFGENEEPVWGIECSWYAIAAGPTDPVGHRFRCWEGVTTLCGG